MTQKARRCINWHSASEQSGWDARGDPAAVRSPFVSILDDRLRVAWVVAAVDLDVSTMQVEWTTRVHVDFPTAHFDRRGGSRWFDGADLKTPAEVEKSAGLAVWSRRSLVSEAAAAAVAVSAVDCHNLPRRVFLTWNGDV